MILGLLVLFIYAWTLVSLLYRLGLSPCLRDEKRFELYAFRDELRNLVIAGKVSQSSSAFQHFEGMLNIMITMCDTYHFSDLLYFAIMEKSNYEASEERTKFDAEAPQAIKEIESKAMDVMKEVMFINSPFWFVVTKALTSTSNKPEKSIELKNRILWHEPLMNQAGRKALAW